MPGLRRVSTSAYRRLHKAERRYDTFKWRVKERFGLLQPLQIIPYRGFGNRQQMFISGRVLEAREMGSPKANHPWWKNAQAMINRFRTDEAPGMAVRGEFHGEVAETVTDVDGYFAMEFSIQELLPEERLWHAVHLTLPNYYENHEPPNAEGLILVPSPHSRFGVISDIDDTVMKSSATNFWRMMKLTFLNNARTRKPFEGVSAFYRALHAGLEGDHSNPFFYVSSSPWNLYDLIHDFLDLNGIPLGPILLRDLIEQQEYVETRHEHKLAKIKAIFETIPDLPFLLIGDSGQEDPKLYLEAVRRYPGRILAIYIRDVSAKRRPIVEQLIEEAKAHDIDMVLAADSYVAAQHAAEHGYLRPDSLEEVQAKRQQDRYAPEAERPTV
jgi:phosphatidate phosphatase APP1